jgi:hypothetical protein
MTPFDDPDSIGDFEVEDAGDDRTVDDLINDPDTDWDSVQRLADQMVEIDELAETDPAEAKVAAKTWAAEFEGGT